MAVYPILVAFVIASPVAALAAPPASPVDPTSPAAEAERYYFEAEDAYRLGAWSRARELLDRAHAARPSALYQFNIGRTFQLEGRFQDAYDAFLRAQAQLDLMPAEHRGRLTSSQLESHLASLRPLLSSAVVAADFSEPGFVQIESARFASEDDQLVAPGWHWVCAYWSGGADAACWHQYLPPGRRTSWTCPPVRDGLGRVRVGLGPERHVRRLALEGTSLASDPATLQTLWLLPGDAHLGVTDDRQTEHTIALQIAAGKDLDLGPLVAPLVAPPDVPPVVGHERSWWPLAPIAGGLALIGGGAALLVDADGIRDDARHAETNGDLVVGLTQKDAFARAATADSHETWGEVLSGVGLSAVVTGIVWWIFDGE